MSAYEQARLTVLVVEDEWIVREMLSAFLKGSNCDVIEAADGEAAAEVLRERDEIDVVFTDIRLGGRLSGWDVGEISRATHPEIPVVYTSGATIVPQRPVPGSVFLAQPYDPEEVLGTCRELCGGRG